MERQAEPPEISFCRRTPSSSLCAQDTGSSERVNNTI